MHAWSGGHERKRLRWRWYQKQVCRACIARAYSPLSDPPASPSALSSSSKTISVDHNTTFFLRTMSSEETDLPESWRIQMLHTAICRIPKSFKDPKDYEFLLESLSKGQVNVLPQPQAAFKLVRTLRNLVTKCQISSSDADTASSISDWLESSQPEIRTRIGILELNNAFQSAKYSATIKADVGSLLENLADTGHAAAYGVNHSLKEMLNQLGLFSRTKIGGRFDSDIKAVFSLFDCDAQKWYHDTSCSQSD